MKELLKKDWLIWVVLLAPFAIIAYFWNQFPEQIPTHWNAKGEVDDYSGKYFGLFFSPLLNIGVYLLFKALPFIDPKKYNYQFFSGKLRNIQLTIHVFFSGLAIVTCFI